LKEITLTTATIALAELAEKGADIDGLRQMVQFMAQRVMELDADGLCGAGHDKKSAERTNSRATSPNPWSPGARPRGPSPR
jgi:putative transposase